MAKPFEIYLPGDVIGRLQEQAILVKEQKDEGLYNAFGGLNRALSWIAKCNCAILSGWRKGNPRKVNDDNNRTILRTLRDRGYGLCRCRGFYPESGTSVDVENSFFVFDHNHTGEDFFECIKGLAQAFSQDCFLFIDAAAGKRFLYGTNDYFGVGKKEYLGALHIGALEGESFTRLGNREIVFRGDADA